MSARKGVSLPACGRQARTPHLMRGTCLPAEVALRHAGVGRIDLHFTRNDMFSERNLSAVHRISMPYALGAILAVNPQILNPNVIFVGQVINMPAGSSPSIPPAHPTKPCNCPQPAPGHELNTAKINYKGGMYIRSEPNGAIIASAVNKSTVYYYRNSFYSDGYGCVWVKVKVFPPTNGYYDGWLLVKDQLGQYFTSPQLGG